MSAAQRLIITAALTSLLFALGWFCYCFISVLGHMFPYLLLPGLT